MKCIVKQEEPASLVIWKALANEDWEPTYRDLCGVEKADVKAALMAEQGHICCYCERRLVDEDSHIEHFQPQSDAAVDSLNFANLLCSCQDQVKKGDPRHCGNLKEDWFDPVLLISPFSPDCADRFSYMGDGRIEPASPTDESAGETIKKLGLDIPKLTASREAALAPFLDEYLSDDEVQEFVSGYLEKDDIGQYGEFWTTVRYLFQSNVDA